MFAVCKFDERGNRRNDKNNKKIAYSVMYAVSCYTFK